MKYYSEILDKAFDTEEECFKAEQQHKDMLAKQKQETQKTEKNQSKAKKELADKVKQAEKNLDQAKKEYNQAEDKVAEILERSNKEITEILTAAKKKVAEAERLKRDALLAFNKEFGAYTKVYTGEQAIEEFNRAWSKISNPFFTFLRNLW